MNLHISFEQQARAKAVSIRNRLLYSKPKPKPQPLPPRDPQFAHIDAWKAHLEDLQAQTMPTAFLKKRCKELGVSYEIITGSRGTKAVCAIRHQIVWEMKQAIAGVTWEDMGRAFKRDHSSIWNSYQKHASLMGEKPQRRGATVVDILGEATIAKMRIDYEVGLSGHKIADKYDISRPSVNRIAQARGWTSPNNVKSAMAKRRRTADRLFGAFEDFLNGMSKHAISVKYGVCSNVVRAHAMRERWDERKQVTETE